MPGLSRRRQSGSNQTRNGRIRRNTIYNCQRPLEGTEPAGIYADGAASVYIDNNEVFASGSGISVGCEVPGFTALNIHVVGNILYSNTRFGAVFGANAGFIENCVFRNNTLFNNGAFFDNSGAVSLQKSIDSEIQNNIIYVLNSDFYGLSLFGWQVDNLVLEQNLFYCPGGENARVYAFNPAEGSTYTEESLWFDNPGFVSDNPLSPHFQLTLSSPAVNSGSQNVELIPNETDMNGLPVVLDGIDVGAYMSDLSTLLNAYKSEPLLYPVPASSVIYFRLPAEDISIYSIDGKLVETSEGRFQSYDVSNLPAGIYLLRFKSSNKERSSRLLVTQH
ncbi:MAG: T9SS type A sorting domain-containing protein [Bacteroidia bacterium]